MTKKYFSKIIEESVAGTQALESHISVELIEETCIVELEGAPPVAYFNEKHSGLNTIVEDIRKIQFNLSTRSANKGEKSILFGAVNRKISKMGFCTQGALLSKNRQLNRKLITVFANVLDGLLKTHLPARHMVGKIKLTQKLINDEYLMGDTNFTSGIINFNSPFAYHKDGFNMTNTYSSMIVYKKNVSGGYLVFPEYGIGFKLDNQSIIQFYGKGILHGVTPIVQHGADGYRISVVYYVSEELDKCLPFDDELKRSRKL